MDVWELSSALAALIWVISMLLPWQLWRNREVVVAQPQLVLDVNALTVVIPARNEALVIADTLRALQRQHQDIRVILVDDESTDDTADRAAQVGLTHLKIIGSAPLAAGWTGKLWAQQQGLQQVQTELTLLLDADIQLAPGLVASLLAKHRQQRLAFISIMAMLKVQTYWEKLLLPAFVYFFKMLYPFALANQPSSWVSAGAGGCILVQTSALKAIGGMAAIKDAVIDDCSLAKQIKAAGFSTWIGLSHEVLSQRPYQSLRDIWEMVARTAYTQLRYSKLLLIVCSVSLGLLYGLPVFGILLFSGSAWLYSVLAVLIMLVMYQPMLRFYALNPAWALLMPVVAGLYLLMTWTSALRYWRGERSRWKGRIYQKG